jgi:CBS domain-containing protein
MLFPIERLISGRDRPLCIRQDQTVRDALALMVENDYSQLPVLNEKGELIGITSDEIITRRYYHIGGTVSLLDLTIDHCLKPAVTLSQDQDIFEALDRLKEVYAVVITEEGKPIGILTNYDMAHFFRDLTGDLLIVEDIEVSLRQIIQTLLRDDEDMNRALIAEFGVSKDSSEEPRKSFEHMTFGDLMYFVTNEANWPQFQKVFHHKDMFFQLMDQVRQNRNQLAHFRGRLDPVQHDVLTNAKDWLEARPKSRTYEVTRLRKSDLQKAEATRTKFPGGKYDPLRDYLETINQEGITNLQLEFAEIEELLGEELPDLARKHRAWWGNDYSTHVQATAWLSAGWLVDDVDMNKEQVAFRQTNTANYPLFFDELLTGLKERRPGVTRTSKGSLNNWLSFSAGATGYAFGWVLPKEPVLRVELYIDRGNRDLNKATIDSLAEKKETIEEEIGAPLDWDRLEQAQASRVSISKPFTFQDPANVRQQAIEWGVDMMLKFVDAFQPRIRNL